MTPPRAKSRLNKKSDRPKLADYKFKKPNLEKFKKHLKSFPLLISAAIAYLIFWWMISNFPPSQIENIIFPKSYLPFHLLLFAGNFFFLSFLFLNSRLGFLFSVLIFWGMFLKLQQVKMDLMFVASVFALGVIILGWQLLTKKTYNGRKKSNHV